MEVEYWNMGTFNLFEASEGSGLSMMHLVKWVENYKQCSCFMINGLYHEVMPVLTINAPVDGYLDLEKDKEFVERIKSQIKEIRDPYGDAKILP